MGLTGTWGVLGGTFDPVHYAHLAVAEQARDALGLDGVLFVPAGVPPHKLDARISPARHRLAMIQLAIADNDRFESSKTEIDRPGASYTIDTLRRLTDEFEGGDAAAARLVLIVSVEALGGFDTWRDPQDILTLARVAAAPRPGFGSPDDAWLTQHFPGQEDRFTFLDGPHLGISSSDVRARVSTGRSVRYLVPDAVRRYIDEHHLYQPVHAAPGRQGGT